MSGKHAAGKLLPGLAGALAILLSGLTAHAAPDGDETGQGRFIDRKAEGWFWYKDPPEEKPAEEPEKIPETVTAQTPPPETAPEEKTAPETDMMIPGSVAWVRENLPKYLDQAIDDPTDENVLAYLLLQRYSTDKSSAFAEKVQLVTMGNPYLDETVNGPSAQGGNAIAKAIAKRNLEIVRDKLKKTAILLFVFDDSEMSLAGSGVVENYRDHTGFTVIPVSMTGRPLRNGIFPDFVTDTGIKKLVNVATFPAVFLVGGNRKPVSVIQGITAESDLDYRVINVAYREKMISEEDYRSLRTSKVAEHSLAGKVDLRAALDGLEPEDREQDDNGSGLIPSREINKRFLDLYLEK